MSSQPADSRGAVCTFYSYKGGVGRTLALANAAAVLASWGYHVLCVDWDLEAPGLPRFFDDLMPSPADEGLVELISAFDDGRALDWRRHVAAVELPDAAGRLDVMSAGRADSSYVARVQDLDWAGLYERGLGAYLEKLRTQWKEAYDFIFVDSRTGLTDIGGVCTIQLPDILLVLFTANHQSLEGAVDVAQRAKHERNKLPFDRNTVPVLPVVTRFEATVEVDLARYWMTILQERLAELLAVWTHKSVTAEQMLTHIRVPYVAHWSFGERLPVVEEGTQDPLGIGYAFETLAALIANRLERTELLVGNRQSYVDSARRAVRARGVSTVTFEFDVFVSHSQSEADFVRELVAELGRRGFRSWFASTAVESVVNVAAATQAALGSSRHYLVLLGERPSPWVDEEVKQFLLEGLSDESSRLVVPVLRGSPESDLPRSLLPYSAVDATGRSADEVATVLAERLWKAAAEEGAVDAALQLGLLGASRGDNLDAERWFRQAAEAGDVEAAFNLGRVLSNRGETEGAIEWYERAAAAGNNRAAFSLGSLLEGVGDAAAASSWYRQAAEAGNTAAIASLTRLLAAGGAQDEAATWHKRGAGSEDAHFRLVGTLLLDGDVVPLLGAGSAHSVGATGEPGDPDRSLPTATGVAEHLAALVDYPADAPQSLAAVTGYVSELLGSRTLYRELHDIFARAVAPGPVDRFLAALPRLAREQRHTPRLPLIVTLRYDDLLERAFAAAGERLDVIYYVAGRRGDASFVHRRPDGERSVINSPGEYASERLEESPVLIKLFGSVDRDDADQDSFVITEEQFDDYLASDALRLVPVGLRARLSNSHRLFMGASGEDRGLRIALRGLAGSAMRLSASWAVQPASGRDAPFWEVRGIDVVDMSLSEYLQQLGSSIARRPAEPASSSTPTTVASTSEAALTAPYPGLRSYTEEDAGWFFAREHETSQVVSNLWTSRLTVLYGESGVGKTSLLHAGVIPQLRQRPDITIIVIDSWVDNPVAAFRAQLGEQGRDSPRSRPNKPSEQSDQPVMVLLDHFDEYFAYLPEDDGPGSFADEFATAVTDPAGMTNVLVCIREDAFARLDRFKGRIPFLYDNYVRLGHLDVAAARRAIAAPLAEYNHRVPEESNVHVEEGLVDALLEQLRVTAVGLARGPSNPRSLRRPFSNWCSTSYGAKSSRWAPPSSVSKR